MDYTENSKTQELAMVIIANSGEAKGLAFQALRTMRETKDLEKAKELLKEANHYIHEAHVGQTELLTMTAKGEEVGIDVLLIHSQDHLMTTMMAAELIEEMILMMEERK